MESSCNGGASCNRLFYVLRCWGPLFLCDLTSMRSHFMLVGAALPATNFTRYLFCGKRRMRIHTQGVDQEAISFCCVQAHCHFYVTGNFIVPVVLDKICNMVFPLSAATQAGSWHTLKSATTMQFLIPFLATFPRAVHRPQRQLYCPCRPYEQGRSRPSGPDVSEVQAKFCSHSTRPQSALKMDIFYFIHWCFHCNCRQFLRSQHDFDHRNNLAEMVGKQKY